MAPLEKSGIEPRRRTNLPPSLPPSRVQQLVPHPRGPRHGFSVAFFLVVLDLFPNPFTANVPSPGAWVQGLSFFSIFTLRGSQGTEATGLASKTSAHHHPGPSRVGGGCKVGEMGFIARLLDDVFSLPLPLPPKEQRNSASFFPRPTGDGSRRRWSRARASEERLGVAIAGATVENVIDTRVYRIYQRNQRPARRDVIVFP